MTPEHWLRVKEVLNQAWTLATGDRAAFLDSACTGNPDLRSRVERLLASDENAGDFLEGAAIDSSSPVTNHEATDPPQYEAGQYVGPYRILKEVGHGGMGTVYMAERADGQYRKRVAIKLVSSGLYAEDILRRFRNERQIAAALDHLHIARLLDGGTTREGRPYLVMEYVEGVRIDTWCDSRKLPVRERLRLFRNVCAAVQYAHERHVVHRDIKPGNILVTADGIPKLLDFGIAKVLDGELSDSPGTTIGPGPMTPEYASPEQVRGERVSPSSDTYSLGVVLYDLLTGQLPYLMQGSDPQSIARVICDQDPVNPSAAVLLKNDQAVSEARSESPSGLRRALAGDLDKIVMKALRKEPERRYPSVAQFSGDLDRFLQDLPVLARNESLAYRGRKFLKRNRVTAMTAGVSAALVLVLVFGVGRLVKPKEVIEAGVRSIAVLPLENLSGDREQEYFADGITDALISDLARVPSLRVTSRTSVMSLRGARKSLPEIARSLGVATIVEGSVLRDGSHVRIVMRLINASKDKPVWTGRYDGELENVLALQSQVAEAIAEEIHVTLASPDRERIAPHQVNLAAYDAYLKGRHQYLLEFTQESTEKAIAYFQQAIAIDPNYAPAYAGLAGCYYLLSNIYYPPTKVMPKAKAAALKALELDDTLGEAHAMLALVRSLYDCDRAEAEKGFKRALELKPSDAEAHLWYGIHLAAASRFNEALAEVELARKLDPVSPGMNTYIAMVLYLSHRYDDALRQLQPIADMNPDYHHPHALLALVYEQKHEWPKAITEMETAYRLDKEPEALAQLGHLYAVSGRSSDARKVLKRLKQLARQRYVSVYNIALVYAGLGERNEAFNWLEKVKEDRSEWFAQMEVDPRLEALHSDPRYAGVLRSAGLLR